MIDLHSHILPDFDDGAKDMETSLAMLAIAQESGTKAIVATPHVIDGSMLPTWDDILERCNDLANRAKAAGLSIKILPGAEVMMTMEFLKKVEGPGAYCINGSRYLLVELPSFEIPMFMSDFFFILQARGIIPILAHPERHPQIIRNPVFLTEWLSQGILIQMNTASIMGHLGEKVTKTAEMLLMNNMVHAFGTDAHGRDRRRPLLGPVVKKVTALIGYETMKKVIITNPEHIINNEDVEITQLLESKSYGKANCTKICLAKMRDKCRPLYGFKF